MHLILRRPEVSQRVDGDGEMEDNGLMLVKSPKMWKNNKRVVQS